MYELRRVESELEADRAAKGVADHVCPPNAEVRQQPAAVGRLVREAGSVCNRAAADVTAPAVGDQPVPVSEGSFGEQRPEGVGDERPVDADHGLAGA